MKQKQATTPKRPTRAGSARLKVKARPAAPKPRPMHKRMLLHPFTVMLLLCAGVLIGGATLRAMAAENLDVTATVPAALPLAPATITAPVTGQHFSAQNITVTGTCEQQTYVKLFRNEVFSGVAQCAANSFQIQTSLLAGANELRAQVYNQTNQAGPPSASVAVYYDVLTPEPPTPPTPLPETPTTVWIENVESADYRDGSVPVASVSPTVSGWAPPWSMITITFHSDPQTCLTQANGSGWWSCTLRQQLPPGLHRVDIKAVTPAGEVLTIPTFQIKVQTAKQPLLAPASPAEPLLVRADYHYQVYLGRQSTDLAVGVTGGTLPYRVTADWGDGTTTSLTRTDNSPFTLSHSYPTPDGANKEYAVLVRATDANGQAALMQLSVIVKGTGIVLIASSTTFGALLDTVQHWLWLIWPAYVVVVLMAIGYYLGEREEYQHLMAKKRGHAAARAR